MFSNITKIYHEESSHGTEGHNKAAAIALKFHNGQNRTTNRRIL